MRHVRTIRASSPIDAIAHFGGKVVAGSYEYNSETGERTGELLEIPMRDNQSHTTRISNTTGTLSLYATDQYLYAANTDNITVYDTDFNVVWFHQTDTGAINTFVFRGIDCFYISNTAGRILIIDDQYNIIRVDVSTQPIWVVKEIGGKLYCGTESGDLYLIEWDLSRILIDGNRLGIIDVVEFNGRILVSGYDDLVVEYSISDQRRLAEYTINKSLWRMVVQNDRLICAAMYDGLVVLNKKYEVTDQYQTESIGYGILVMDDGILISSFYTNTIELLK
ncbi:hypothetical protein ECANGB1_1694 [Enterospora canceri]|uniref:Uncharacterized protein n=1 Tax=Enterospora canceri TaxID=1081671 RepID=A0A1Y1S949_9MICR|nr:hypothetical protein ECANGB1_1694 [Enterospora canceri]